MDMPELSSLLKPPSGRPFLTAQPRLRESPPPWGDAPATDGEHFGAGDTVKVVIADGDRLSRERLRGLLDGWDSYEIVAECATGLEAVDQIRFTRPDLVFLDVRMPDLDGFQVLEAVDGEHNAIIIFVTASGEFALRAFEAEAADYLLKPFDGERFNEALKRARRAALDRDREESAELLLSFLRQVRARRGYPVRLLVNAGKQYEYVETRDIVWIEARDSRAILHARDGDHTLREVLRSLQSRLDPERFLRISKSAIINVEEVRSIRPRSSSEYVIQLTSGVELMTGRGYREILRQALFT
jgi:two-component system LytT family response regulator